jgi:cell division transport system permease protein
MNRILSDLWFFIHEGYLNFSRSRVVTFFSIIIIAVSLSVITVFATFFYNIDSFLEKFQGNPVYSVFLKKNATKKEINNIVNYLNSLEGTSDINYISPQEGMKKLMQRFSYINDIKDSVGENPVPPAIRLRVQKGKEAQITKLADNYRIIDEIYSPNFFVEKLEQISGALSAVFLAVALILIAASVFTVYNVVRITVFARQTDIDIMQLVGASMIYIRAPFIVEGIFQGLTGGVFGVLLGNFIVFILNKIYFSEITYLPFLSNMTYLPPFYILNIVLLATMFGLAGSFVAASRIDYV